MNSLINAGSENKIVRLVQFLAEQSWAVEVVYLNPPHDLKDQFPATVPLTFLDRKKRIDRAAIARLKKMRQERQPTIVVAVNVFPLVYLHLSDFQASGNTSTKIALINKTEYLPGLAEKFRAQVYAWIMRRWDLIVFGAKSQRNLWVHRYRLQADKSTVIYNGVDVERFSPELEGDERNRIRRDLGLAVEDFVLVTVAGLRPVKRIQMLVQAMAVLTRQDSKLKAIIVGDGPERGHLERLSEDLSVEEHVKFVGNVRDVRPYLTAGDLFVLTSSSETFSNAALEAMSMAKAVILPDVGGSAEMIRCGSNGWLFEPGNMDELVATISEAANSRAETLRRGRVAREVTLELFRNEYMFEKYSRTFSEALHKAI